MLILVFGGLYLTGSSFLATFFDGVFESLGEFLDKVFSILDFQWLILFGFGVLMLSASINKVSNGFLVDKINSLPDLLLRNRKKKPFRRKVFFSNMLSLKIEKRIGFLALVTLNGMLLMTNLLDVFNLWIGFEPSKVRLSQFVHEGTYVLIFTIILASLVILFYFRGNLNFISNNKYLKLLAKIWILQNAVLALSVGIRNFHYVDYTHALTDKRIGVFIFLILVLAGLFLLYQKVEKKKTTSWLVKSCVMLFFSILSVSQIVNWERIMITYNMSNEKPSSIDMTQLFNEIDYDLIYLDQKIENTPGLFYSFRGSDQNDTKEQWERIKGRYLEVYSEHPIKFWHYQKHKNLKAFNYEKEIKESK